MGPVETRIRRHVTAGMVLRSIPGKAPFIVEELATDSLILLLGDKLARTLLTWSCLERIPDFLSGKDPVRIGSTKNTRSLPGTLHWYLTVNCIKRMTAGYVAAILEKTGIIEDLHKTSASIKLKGDWNQ